MFSSFLWVCRDPKVFVEQKKQNKKKDNWNRSKTTKQENLKKNWTKQKIKLNLLFASLTVIN